MFFSLYQTPPWSVHLHAKQHALILRHWSYYTALPVPDADRRHEAPVKAPGSLSHPPLPEFLGKLLFSFCLPKAVVPDLTANHLHEKGKPQTVSRADHGTKPLHKKAISNNDCIPKSAVHPACGPIFFYDLHLQPSGHRFPRSFHNRKPCRLKYIFPLPW